MSNCIFCRIVAKEIPAAVVYEDEHTLAFMDAGQVNPGHVLVAAKGHAENLYELSDTQASALLRTAARVARDLPAVRLVIAVRDPIERLTSAYRFWMQVSPFKGTFDEFLREHPAQLRIARKLSRRARRREFQSIACGPP